MRVSNIDHQHNTADSERRLMRACEEFETLILTYVLRAMRNTECIGDGFLRSSTVSRSYRDMFDFEVARAIFQRANLGIAKLLFEKLVVTLKSDERV